MRLVVALLLSVSLSGCLANDIWREPYGWRTVYEAGENPDAAQAFGQAFGDAPERAFSEGDQVVSDVQDLPDSVYFQNLKAFVERQAPGRGEELEAGARTVTTAVGDGYAQLTGPVAEAWDTGTAEFASPSQPVPFPVADRATRVRITIDVALAQSADPEGTNPTPLGTVEMRLTDPQGGERGFYRFDATRHLEDMFIVGTYGDDNEVREDLGGTWLLEVSATGEGAWSAVVEAYEPTYDDYRWWQFWRGEPRRVVGE